MNTHTTGRRTATIVVIAFALTSPLTACHVSAATRPSPNPTQTYAPAPPKGPAPTPSPSALPRPTAHGKVESVATTSSDGPAKLSPRAVAARRECMKRLPREYGFSVKQVRELCMMGTIHLYR